MVFVVGIIIGLVLGLTGAGGSVFAVPLLMMLLGLPVQQAIGLSLGAVAISAMYGGFLKFKSGDIQWLPAAVYAVIGGLVAPIGNWANRQIDETLLMVGFSLLVSVIAGRMWLQASRQPQQALAIRASIDKKEVTNGAICAVNGGLQFRIGLPCVLGVSAGAIITGFLSGLFGVGGGFVIVPTLLFLTGITIKQAVATSLVVIAVISSSGFAGFLLTGSVINAYFLSLVALGGVIGMTLGIFASKYIAGPVLQKIFSVLMLFMAALILIKEF